jgi:hypothetical protein
VPADAAVTTVRGGRSRTKVVAVARAMVRRSMWRRMKVGCGHGGGERNVRAACGWQLAEWGIFLEAAWEY